MCASSQHGANSARIFARSVSTVLSRYLGLAAASAELGKTSSWALLGKFDTEFGSGTQTYAGTARGIWVMALSDQYP